MQKTVLILVITFFTFYVSAQSSSEGWVKQIDGKNPLTPLIEDNDGNLYSSGVFDSPSITIDNITLTTDENTSAIFILKTNAQGNAIWAKKIASGPGNHSARLKADEEGNLYLYGEFEDELSFGQTSLTSTVSFMDMFLAKLDSEGNLIWVKKAGGECTDCYMFTRDIMISAENNIIITGSFNATSVNFGSNVISTSGNNNVYIVKYDSDGNDLWAKTHKGDEQNLNTALLSPADGENFYIAGMFSDNLYNIGNINLSGNGELDVYYAEYDAQGNALWAKSFGGTGIDTVASIATDSLGNMLLLSYFTNSITIGNTNLTSAGNSDVLVCKLSAVGDVIWTKTIGSEAFELGYKISSDSNNNIFVSGGYVASLTLGNTILTSQGESNTFFTKMDTAGNFIYAFGIYSIGFVSANITTFPSGNIFAAGIFKSNITINNETITIGTNEFGYFYSKLGSDTLASNSITLSENVSIYPNPAENTLNIVSEIDSNLIFTIADITGRIVKQGFMDNKTTDISFLPSGLYIFTINNGINTKFIKE